MHYAICADFIIGHLQANLIAPLPSRRTFQRSIISQCPRLIKWAAIPRSEKSIMNYEFTGPCVASLVIFEKCRYFETPVTLHRSSSTLGQQRQGILSRFLDSLCLNASLPQRWFLVEEKNTRSPIVTTIQTVHNYPVSFIFLINEETPFKESNPFSFYSR